MQHAEYRRHVATGGMTKDVETWLGNSLALVLGSLAIAGAIIAWFVAMGYITTATGLTQFEGGMTWFAGSIVLAITANIFRREHHIVDAEDDVARVVRE
jgi:type IV secretory pathway VirB2 component (pilin)